MEMKDSGIKTVSIFNGKEKVGSFESREEDIPKCGTVILLGPTTKFKINFTCSSVYNDNVSVYGVLVE